MSIKPKSEKVVKFEEINTRYPNDELIGYLTELLEDAKLGELRSMFFICGWSGDRVSSGHTHGNGVSLIKMLGEYEYNRSILTDWVKKFYES